MPRSHFQLLSNCPDAQLRRICERRKIPLPQHCDEGSEGRLRLLKTMVFHLEENRALTNTLADLGSSNLRALKQLAEANVQPADGVAQDLLDLGLLLPLDGTYVVPERVADALVDFDDAALAFQEGSPEQLLPVPPFGFFLALTSVLLRCVPGIRVLKGGLPAKKELGQLLNRNVLIRDERDATLLFALLHRLGLLWTREGRVDTLMPAVLSHPPRWFAERAFSLLMEHDLKAWNMPPSEDRRFLVEHLLERRGQVLATQPFLAFLKTLHPLEEEPTRAVFLPFLARMGLVAMDAAQAHLTLSEHGEALAAEYLTRDGRATEPHWAPFLAEEPLVLQPNLELLTPLIQNPHRLLKLAQIADVDHLDALATFRLSHETLVRALDGGIALEEIRARLGGEAARLPQPLARLLEDLGERLGEVEVSQGVRLVRTRTAALAEELRVRPELASLALVPLSDTVLEANGPGNAFALLKQAGFLPKPGRFLPVSLDGHEDLYLWALACLAFVDEKGMNHHLEPMRQLIRGTLQRIQAEDPNLHQEIKRRIPMLHSTEGSQGAEEAQKILEYAASFTLMVELSYLPLAAHRAQLRRVTPLSIEDEHLRAFCHLHQEEMSFRLKRIIGVRLLNERGWQGATTA